MQRSQAVLLLLLLAASSALGQIVPGPPRISSFNPTTGTAFDVVTVTGTEFNNVFAVWFGDVQALSFFVDSPQQLRAVVPSDARTAPMAVDTNRGRGTSSTSFFTRPTVQIFSPDCAAQGSGVNIGGTNFRDVTAVTFNGMSAPFLIHNANALTAIVPTGATSGPIVVTTPGGSGSPPSTFNAIQTLVVTNTSDSGPATLRQAILDSNASPCRDTIRFNIPGTGPFTISVLTGLPEITSSVVIDGRTQPGWTSTTPQVALSGASLGGPADGFNVGAPSTEIYGMVIHTFPFAAIHLRSAGNIVKGNFIGTDATGMTALPHTQDGIRVSAANNVIGGDRNTWERNIIAGTGQPSFTTGGIILFGGSATGNTIKGNYLGVNVTGMGLIGGNNPAVRDWSGGGNTYGGTGPADGNLVGGNWVGLDIQSSNATVQGNYIGTDVTGTRNFSNAIGIFMQGSNHLVGGTTTGAGNVIAFNAYFNAIKGSGIYYFAGSGSRFLGNSIYKNSGLGIDLDPPPNAGGVTPNDAGDIDSGPNALQNFPVIDLARFFGGRIRFDGTLNSWPSTDYAIEFFSSEQCHSSGFGPGQRFGGRLDPLTADGIGNVSFVGTFSSAPLTFATATATDNLLKNTSEFSACALIRRIPADVNFDAKWDLIWRNISTGSDSLWMMTGMGVVTASLPAESDTNWKIAGIGDFQGDGKGDVLWRHQLSGANRIWFMDGTSIALSATVMAVFDVNWQVAGVGDFQGDGKADILWRNAVSGANSAWLMDGSTVAASATLPTVSDPAWTVGAIGDFQGDGKSDIMWHNGLTGDNSMWLLDGMTMAVSASLPPVSDTNWKPVGAGDFQADGKADIVWRNSSTGDNSIWFMSGANVASSASLPSVADTAWKIVKLGDFQGDGKSDLFWRNSVSGANSVWLMNGGTLAVSGTFPTVADVNWQVAGRP